MKYTISFLLIVNFFFAQEQKKASTEIKLSSVYGSKSDEMNDLFQMQLIDYYNLKFSSADFNQKDFIITSKELWDGKVKKIDTLVNTSRIKSYAKSIKDSLKIRVIAMNTNDGKIKLNFIFPRFSVNKIYEATISEDYSFRILNESEKFSIFPGKEFVLGAYILPYVKNGYKYWCDVENSGVDVEKWGEKFDIKHYLIFEMKFLKNEN